VKIVVSGMTSDTPGQGGATWAVLQYVLGLRKLRHDVALVEPVRSLERSAGYFRRLARTFALDGILLERGSDRRIELTTWRPDGADLLLNLSGVLPESLRADLSVYVDLDPGFTQAWHEQGVDVGLEGHDRFVTVGRLIGQPDCPVPVCNRRWITTPQPVVLGHWPYATEVRHEAATTIGHWRSYGSFVHGGIHYGQRAHATRELIRLPGLTKVRVLLALGIDRAERDDLAALSDHGWELTDPTEVASTPEAYRTFVQGSLLELGIPKRGYVESRSGWFSDRSVCYLASGRPVVAQDTGFTDWLPTGEGLLSFGTVEEAAGALEEAVGDYDRHRRAAREIAGEVFDSDRVLKELLACL
jgi:hypothetical protein